MKKETNYNVREFLINYETELYETPCNKFANLEEMDNVSVK